MIKDTITVQEQLNRIEKYALLGAKNVLTFEEAIMFTGLSKSTLYKLSASHSVPCYKPRQKLLYFEKKELELWLLQNRQNTTDEIESKALNYVVTGQL